jgi:hypothetical protein
LQAAGGTIWTEHSPSVTVGEEGQLATKTGGGQYEYSTVFGGQQLTAGVHYMEVEVGGEEMNNLYVGIARPGLDTADGKDYLKKECMDVWFMNTNYGDLYGNSKQYDDEAGEFEAGDRIGLLLDLDNYSLLFFKNGEKHGPGYGAGSVTGPVVLAMQMYYKDQSGRVVAGAVRPSGYEGAEAVLSAAGKEEQLAPSTVETVRAHTVRILYSHCTHTLLILYSHCAHTVPHCTYILLTLYSYSTLLIPYLYSYCTHTVLILYSYCTHSRSKRVRRRKRGRWGRRWRRCEKTGWQRTRQRKKLEQQKTARRTWRSSWWTTAPP